jgi:hypothetical protein
MTNQHVAISYGIPRFQERQSRTDVLKVIWMFGVAIVMRGWILRERGMCGEAVVNRCVGNNFRFKM